MIIYYLDNSQIELKVNKITFNSLLGEFAGYCDKRRQMDQSFNEKHQDKSMQGGIA